MEKSPDTKRLDTYLGLSAEVYELSRPQVPRDAYLFYREYAALAKGPILEPMCGTGRFLLPLLAEGFDIHGFDASEHMLMHLHEKAKAQSLRLKVWHGFNQDLNKLEKYNLIFIPSGSFCLMTNLEDVKTALKKFHDHLKNDGIFLFEVDTQCAVPQLNIWRGSLLHKTNGHKILISKLATMPNNICNVICKYELMEKNRILNTEIEELKIIIYEQDQLADMLKAAGFNHIRILKTFDRTKKPDEQDESVVYECRK